VYKIAQYEKAPGTDSHDGLRQAVQIVRETIRNGNSAGTESRRFPEMNIGHKKRLLRFPVCRTVGEKDQMCVSRFTEYLSTGHDSFSGKSGI
jgi:hypothetical protein